jgi:hypothetical protein
MCKSRYVVAVYLFSGLILFATNTNSAVIQYLDRTSWSSAVGTVSGTEDFSGFVSDTQFRTQTVALNGMSVSVDGVSQHLGTQANKIDVAAFEFPGSFDVDGSSYLLADIELAESVGAFVPINLRFDFSNPLSAWGVDLASFANATSVQVEVFGPNPTDAALASFHFPHGSGSPVSDFFGFHITDGLLADHIVFSIAAGSGYETIGMDNIAYVSAIPVPAAIWLFGSGMLGLIGIARRKKVA